VLSSTLEVPPGINGFLMATRFAIREACETVRVHRGPPSPEVVRRHGLLGHMQREHMRDLHRHHVVDILQLALN
jgi:hypothetical protein